MSLDLARWAERFVATPSLSRDGNAAIARLAAELLGELGLPARVEPARVEGLRHHTVLCDVGPEEGEDGLLLVTHLDTVPPGDPAAWTATDGDPWRPVRKGDLLYGLGAADAKVDFVCKAAALGALEHGRLRRRVRLAGTFGEEIGLLGARWLVESGGTRGFTRALVGEPSELVAIRAHKGYACLETRVALRPLPEGTLGVAERVQLAGRAAHSSDPTLGVNAIERAFARLEAPDVLGLRSIEGGVATNVVPDRCALELVRAGGSSAVGSAWDAGPLVAFGRAWRALLERAAATRDPRFDPDHSVGNLGKIALREGTAVLSLDLRPVPGVKVESLVEALGAFARVELVRSNPPLEGREDSALLAAVVRAQERCGLGARVGTKATCTEAGLLSRAGLDAVVLGAGRSIGNVHAANEHTRLSELGLARDLYREVIMDLCMEGQG